MKALFLFLAVALAGALAASGPAGAERRVALVMGNSSYRNTASLPNTVNDALVLGSALRRLGFQVVEGTNLNFVQMNAKFKEFGRAMAGADVALFYYAGHGMQASNENYLVPVDAALREAGDLEFETIKVDQVLRMMVRESKIKILLLDSCRDNPLANELARSIKPLMRTATPSSGLAQIDASAASGTVIAFATAPGSTALDGRGGHSPFAEALLEHIETPGLDIDLVMKRVRGYVSHMTGQRQQPWTSSSLNGEFYLRPALAPFTEAAAPNNAAKAPAGPETAAIEPPKAPLEAEKSPAEPGTAPAGPEPASPAARQELPPYAPRFMEAPADLSERAREPADENTERELRLKRNHIRDIHVRLRLLGLYNGPPQGRFGRKSREAIKAWQESAGLEPTGYLNLWQASLLAERTQAAHDAWSERGGRFLDGNDTADDSGGRRRRRRGGGGGDFGDFIGGVGGAIGNVLPF